MNAHSQWAVGDKMLRYIERGKVPERKLSRTLSIFRGPIDRAWTRQFYGIRHHATVVAAIVCDTRFPAEDSEYFAVIPKHPNGERKLRWSSSTNGILYRIERYFSSRSHSHIIDVPYCGIRGLNLNYYTRAFDVATNPPHGATATLNFGTLI